MHLPLFQYLPLTLLTILPTLSTAVIISTTVIRTHTLTGDNAAVPTSTPTTSSQTSPEYTSDKDFESTVLNSTNTYRAQHNATALSWNTSLASYATNWANKCQWAHSHGPYGENIAENYPNVTDALAGWGDERQKYDFSKGAFGEGTGHFTQMVWKGTTSFGCGRANCKGKPGATVPEWFVVCEYWPPGNVQGQFKQEVGTQIHKFVKHHGGDDVAQYVLYLHDKMTGAAGRATWSWGAVVAMMMAAVGMGSLMW